MGALEGKVAVVTGSSSGIGEAVARRFAAEGATVVVSSATSVEAGEAVAGSLPSASYVQCDISDEAACRRLVDAALERHGRLDVLVNNAGTTKVIPHKDLDAATDDVWRRILDVNLMGTWYLSRAALPALKATGDGVIVNVTSLAGVKAAGSSIPYAVSKAALNHLTRLMANVSGPEVRINAVAPGLIATPWTADWDAQHAAIRAGAPLARSGEPDDIAATVLGVVVSRYMTGEVVLADGGVHLR